MNVALITVYYPSESVYRNVLEVSKQTDIVYICDNTPEKNSERSHKFESMSNVCYRFLGENLGLSGAFNKVLLDSQIDWNDEDYVFFFDQDSLIGTGLIERLVQEYESLNDLGYCVGCLGPVYFNTSNNTVEVPRMKVPLNDTSYSVPSIITSSMLCTYGNLREIGFWNEKIFLDMADWDLCWRFKEQGKLCCLTNAVTLRHSLGEGEKKVGPIRLRVGSPFREYYQIREALHLLFQRYTPLKYRVLFLAMLFVRSPLHVLFLNDRKNRLRYILMGIRDFIKGKHGALLL